MKKVLLAIILFLFCVGFTSAKVDEPDMNFGIGCVTAHSRVIHYKDIQPNVEECYFCDTRSQWK
jgi:hypothetical protein